jgi:hypothetical protein
MAPMRHLSRVSFIAMVFCAMPLFAESLRLTAPHAGEVLQGGAFATVQWSATGVQPNAEEWEAFLSIDGGAYYAFRITPHLDLGIRRFAFVVPNVDTANARILIRTGDEKRETLWELPERFSIVRGARAEVQVPHVGSARGEAAREGDPAVLSWTDGQRNGSGVTQESWIPVPSSSLSAHTTLTHHAPVFFAPASNAPIVPSLESTTHSARVTPPFKFAQRPASVDLLLVCSRRNI